MTEQQKDRIDRIAEWAGFVFGCLVLIGASAAAIIAWWLGV